MKKEELYQLRNLKHEIEMLEQEQKYLQKAVNTNISDSVSASSIEFPYTKHSITVKGISKQAIEKLKRNEQKIRLRKIRCIDEYDRLNDFIATVPDSEMRQILTLYYIDCLPWKDVAKRMHVQGDGSTQRKQHDSFLKLSPNSPN